MLRPGIIAMVDRGSDIDCCPGASSLTEVLSVHYRNLGTSNLMVSEIALGSWLTYSGGVEKARSIACVRRALDLGVTLLDSEKRSLAWFAATTSSRRSYSSR